MTLPVIFLVIEVCVGFELDVTLIVITYHLAHFYCNTVVTYTLSCCVQAHVCNKELYLHQPRFARIKWVQMHTRILSVYMTNAGRP